MIKRKRVACFFTGGFTELNAMKAFMKKINDKVDYIQLCPTGTRKSKDSIKNRRIENISNFQNGLTNESLISYVLSEVEKNHFREESYDAVIIEDDKDNRFLRVQSNGLASIDLEGWKNYKIHVLNRLAEKGVSVPVIFFLAAPEVESWFIADYQNSFGKVFATKLSSRQNCFFSNQFNKYLKSQILTKAYINSIESYGYFNNFYYKLSEKIQDAIYTNAFFSEETPSLNSNISLRYSKRVEGEEMLYNIDPQTVSKLCNKFFKESYLELQQL